MKELNVSNFLFIVIFLIILFVVNVIGVYLL